MGLRHHAQRQARILGLGVGGWGAAVGRKSARYGWSSWGSPGQSASSRARTPSGSRVARTFLFSLKRPEREIFKLRRLLPALSAHNLSGLWGSPALARRLGCWFSWELLVQSGLGGAGSPGAGWAGGCTPTEASLPFFLLFTSDFHQGPELPVPPLSAMAGRGSGAPRVGKASAAAVTPFPGGLGRPLRSFSRCSQPGCGVGSEAAVCAAQDPRGSAGDSVNGVRLGPPGGGPGGVRLLWGGVPAEISAARLSGLVVMVSPGTSDCCGRRRPRARCAEGPAASVCQLDAQVSAQAAL